MKGWRLRGWPLSSEDREGEAAPGAHGDPRLEDVGGHDLGRGPGVPGGESCDREHHSHVQSGHHWWPCQVEEGLVREGHSEGNGGLEEKQVPGCRGPGAAGKEVEDGLRQAGEGSTPQRCLLTSRRPCRREKWRSTSTTPREGPFSLTQMWCQGRSPLTRST